MSSLTEEMNFEFVYLYGCDTCERFYALDVDDSEQPSCPQEHPYAKLATPSSYGEHTICVSPDCGNFMKMNKLLAGARCDGGCNRSGEKIKEHVDGSGVIADKSVLRKHVSIVETESTGPAAGLARSLTDQVNKADGFKTGHHKDKSGHHTASAKATHDHGNKSNANIRQRKAEAIKLALENLRAAEDFDEKKYKDILLRGDVYVKKYGRP